MNAKSVSIFMALLIMVVATSSFATESDAPSPVGGEASNLTKAPGKVPSGEKLEDLSSAAKIAEIEQQLLDLKYYAGSVTGKSSANLVEAIKKYQASLQAEPTGQLTSRQAYMLRKTWRNHPVDMTDEAAVLEIEHYLGTLKYYPNQLTGKPSKELDEAIRKFQLQDSALGAKKATGKLLNRELGLLRRGYQGLSLIPVIPSKRFAVEKYGDEIRVHGSMVSDGNDPKLRPVTNQIHITCNQKKLQCVLGESLIMTDVGSNDFVGRVSLYDIVKNNPDRSLIARRVLTSSDPETLYAQEGKCLDFYIEINLDNRSAFMYPKVSPTYDRKSELCQAIVSRFKEGDLVKIGDGRQTSLDNYTSLYGYGINSINTGQKGRMLILYDRLMSRLRLEILSK